MERGDADEDEFEPSTATAETNGGVADSQRPDDYDREQDDAVFLKSFIPRNLNEVHDPERDAAKLKRGEGDDLIYARHTGIAELASTLPTLSVSDSSAVKVNGHNDEEEGETEDSGTEEEGDSKDPSFGARQPRGHRHEDKDAKKVCHSL